MNACSFSFESRAAVKMRAIRCGLPHALDAFGSSDQTQRGDRARTARTKHVAGGGQGTSRGEHRVDDVCVPAREVVGESFEVGERPVRRLVTLQADHTDFGVGEGREHAVEKPEAGAQDRDHQRTGHRRPHTPRDEAERRRHFVRLGGQVTRGFVREEARQLAGDATEVDGLRALVAQREHAVGHQRMIDDGERHGRK